MVQNVVHGTYTETYDLNTAIGELSMLSIHTPTAISLKRMYKGFFENYSKIKILGCNFRMVCLSQQALTPDLVGLEAGKVDPRDIANPLLFKACTGENINVLLNQIYNKTQNIHGATDDASIDEHVDSRTAAINAYYTMLADDSFRREHPQKGITVMGLKPMVHKIVTTQPFKWTVDGSGTNPFQGDVTKPALAGASAPGESSSGRGFGAPSGSNLAADFPVNPSVFVSNGLTEMPWLDTAFVKSSGTTSPWAQEYIATNIPRVYCGLLVLPPAILQRLFFRLQIVWHIAFKDFRPAYEIGALETHVDSETTDGMTTTGLYHNYYHNAVPEGQKEVGSFSATESVEIEPIIEKVA